MNTIIEKIRAEIERRIKICNGIYERDKEQNPEMSNYYHGKAVALCELVPRLDTLQEQPVMIEWTGNNLKEVIEFTGKSPRFDEWFKTWDEYESYVHSHGNIFKLFNEDWTHLEVPVGAWIVKTPDGRNVPSAFLYQEQPVKWNEDEFAHLVGCMIQDIVANEKDNENYGVEKKPTRFFVEKYKDRFKSICCKSKQGQSKEQDNNKLGEIARHILAIKDHLVDMRLDDGEIELLKELGYPERKEQEQPVCEDLEEEITIISKNEYFDFSDWKAIARHFAYWQKLRDNPGLKKFYEKGWNDCKEEMMKKAVEGEVVKDISNKLAVTAKINLDGFKFGDKVRIIIVKED